MKEVLSGIGVCLFELVVGILLLVNPIGFTSAIIIGSGFILLAIGVFCTIKYFFTEPAEAAKRQLLVKGLVALLAGAFCVIKSEWFVALFPVLTLVYGAAILVAGLVKFQKSIDSIRLKKTKWYLTGISALIFIACGTVVIFNPFGITNAVWVFTGIVLIVEAVMDLIAMIFGSAKPKAEEAEEEVAVEETEE